MVCVMDASCPDWGRRARVSFGDLLDRPSRSVKSTSRGMGTARSLSETPLGVSEAAPRSRSEERSWRESVLSRWRSSLGRVRLGLRRAIRRTPGAARDGARSTLRRRGSLLAGFSKEPYGGRHGAVGHWEANKK
jgi:hypothetical protein